MSDHIDSWDAFFIELARVHARKSKDPSTRVGAVIVGPDREVRAGGFNGLPRGVRDCPKEHPERHARPAKYSWWEHAERNAIYNAARSGATTRECTLYVAGGPPCADCARAAIQSGIVEVVAESLEAPAPPMLCVLKLDHDEQQGCEPDDRCALCGRTVREHREERREREGAIDWRASVALGLEMMREAGMRVRKARLE